MSSNIVYAHNIDNSYSQFGSLLNMYKFFFNGLRVPRKLAKISVVIEMIPKFKTGG